jgi:multiple sugar transport system substrate-binding protein
MNSVRGNTSANTVQVAAVEGEGRLFQRLVKDYVEEDTGVEVNVTMFPFSNLFEKTSSVLDTKGDSYDIFFLADIWLPQFAVHCEPLKKWTPNEYETDAMIQACVNDGTWPSPGAPMVPSASGMKQKLRAQVVVGNAQLFAYNKAYFEQVGAKTPPKTWDDVLSAGKKIDEQLDGVDGYVIRGKRGNPITSNYFSVGRSIAGKMFDENWRYQWDEKKGVEALRFYTEDLKSISPEGVASFDSDEVLNRLSTGTAAQGAVWPAAASLLLDSKQSKVAGDIAFTICPKGASHTPQLGTWMTAINKHIDDSKKKAAGKVISSFSSREAQQKYVDLGGVPFRHDSFKNNMDVNPWYNALYKSLQQAVWRPRTPLWTEMEIRLGKYLNTALTGESTPKEMMRNANDEFERMLKESGYYDA